jgi:hypothetical protein
LLLVLGVVAGGQLRQGGTDDRSPTALIRAADGDVFGRVELASSPEPRVVVVVDGPYDWRGTWACELRRPDGTWVEVGRWTSTDAPTGAWTAEVDRSLLDATAMRITAGDGVVIAMSDRLS